jgi:Cytochrome c peroxidase
MTTILSRLLFGALAGAPLLLSAGTVSAFERNERALALKQLGKSIFNDDISVPPNTQGCHSCHELAKGGILPDSRINLTTVVAPGAAAHALGSIKPPTNIYATFSPPFTQDNVAPSGFIGGTFWDGRAEGWGATALGGPVGDGAVSETVTADVIPVPLRDLYSAYLGPVADQALNPFPNPVEQNIRRRRVCLTVKIAPYRYQYVWAFGEPIDCGKELDTSYKRIALALAAYQASSEVNQFSSRRDKALKVERDGAFPLKYLTFQENLGHDLFYGLNDTGRNRLVPDPNDPSKQVPKNAQCAACHQGVPQGESADPTGVAPRQLYTDSRYHNIGAPYNRDIPDVAIGEKAGLSDHQSVSASNIPALNGLSLKGFFKTPTLRNVDKGVSRTFRKAYFHNGWCKDLACVVHFYNTRDVLDRCESRGIVNATAAEASRYECWPESEFNATASDPNRQAQDPVSAVPGVGVLVGNLGLRPYEEAAIVAFLKTLSDD